jgi:hypothetical protein
MQQATRQALTEGTRVKCFNCPQTYVIEQNVRERAPFEGHSEITELGLLCPHCGHWQHIQLDSPEVQRLRNSLERAKVAMHKDRRTLYRRYEREGATYGLTLEGMHQWLLGLNKGVPPAVRKWQQAKRRFQAGYDALQAEWRPKLGATSPTAELQAQRSPTVAGEEKEP